jgi:methyltransferase-like protein
MRRFEYYLKTTDIDRIFAPELVEVEKMGKPIIIEQDEKRDDIIIINGKPIKVIGDSEWAYKVTREGIRTNIRTASAFYDALVENSKDNLWNKHYFAMLAGAWKKCKAIKEDKPC